MKSTGWIVVAGWLIAAPVFAQSLDSPPSPLPSEDTSADNSAAPSSDLPSFESELSRLRQGIATMRQLREQVAEEAGQPLATDAAATQKQRRELLELLTKLASKSLSHSSAPAPEPAKPQKPAPEPIPVRVKTVTKPSPTSDHPLITDKIVDPFGLGRALFRAGDYRGAEQAFRKVKVTEDNRVLVQYLIATCLRKQSLWEQAVKAYRVVAENNVDPALRDLAVWQLENIHWHRQTESQLEQLRELRESTDRIKAPSRPAEETATTK